MFNRPPEGSDGELDGMEMSQGGVGEAEMSVTQAGETVKSENVAECFQYSQKFLIFVKNVLRDKRVSSGVEVTPGNRFRLKKWATIFRRNLGSLEVC